MRTCYYAHCMAIYDTPQEARDVATLQALGFGVINPNTPQTQEACEEAKDAGQNVMEEIFRPMVEDAYCTAFRALPDGSIPSGVALEIGWAIEAGNPVIELPSGITRRRLTLEQTREYLREAGQR